MERQETPGDRARRARDMAGLTIGQATAQLREMGLDVTVAELSGIEDSDAIGDGILEPMAQLYRVSPDWLRTGKKKPVGLDLSRCTPEDRAAIREVLGMMPRPGK